jgi:hypothetical protein
MTERTFRGSPSDCTCPAWGDTKADHAKDCPMVTGISIPVNRGQQNARGIGIPADYPHAHVAEAVFQLTNHQQQLDEDGVMVGVSREALDVVLAHVHAVADDRAGVPICEVPYCATMGCQSGAPHCTGRRAERPGAWEGPFRVEKGLTHLGGDMAVGGEEPAMVQLVEVAGADGSPFCYVLPEDCHGGDMTAAKARATRIAEALNRSQGTGLQLTNGWTVDRHGVLHMGSGLTLDLTGITVQFAKADHLSE